MAREYLLAAAASALAWLLSYPLEPYVDRGDFPLYLGAVMLSAWYGGLGPGLLTTVVGAFVGMRALVGMAPGSASISASVITRLGVFALEALVICVVCDVLRRTESRAQTLAASEQGARRALEAAAHQIRAVQRVTDTALTHLRLDDLLPELLGRVRDAMAADTVVILLLNDEGTELAVKAAHGLEEEVTLDMRIPFGRGIAGTIAERGVTSVIDDVSRVAVSPILRAKGLHTLLGTPLVLDGSGIGVVHVGSLSPRRFTPDDARLLELVADRIATAIGRARLFGAEQRARHDAETAEGRFRLLVDGVRDYAFYMLDRAGRVEAWNAGAERLHGYTADEIVGQHVARFYLPDEARQGAPARTLERAATEGRAVEEGWRIRKGGSRFWAEGLTTAVRDPEGLFVGYSVVTHDVTERRRHAEVRARLLEQVTVAQEEEQRRLARELHDETGQSLTSLLVGLRTLSEAPSLSAAREQVAELRRVAARTLDEVRRLARGLRPGVLDELGLVPAVDQLALDHAQMRSLPVEVSAVGFGLERLPPAVEASLYRIIQEALTNAAKHSSARTASVVLQRRREVVQAIVSDDGCGFDVEGMLRTPAARAHLGLHGMRERAALLGGTVTIESTPGEGTTIYVRVPVLGGSDGKDPDPHRG
ncbi:MAG TPA: PAS domain S-box protein [Methylomirabilota bacterium]|jgi:PAS domain S-box-containing protein